MTLRNLVQAEPDCRTSLETFWRILSETVGWCAARAKSDDPAGCLRHAHLRPRALHSGYFDAVSSVILARGQADPQSAKLRSLAGGRLLVYFPDADLCDGAAEAASDGFFDVYNCPPWDTWVGMFRDVVVPDDVSTAQYLVAWVPPNFLDLASHGIAVNPEDCIAWLDDAKPGLWSLLQSADTAA